MTVSNTIFLTRNSEWSIPKTVCYFFQPFKSICKLIFGISKKIFNWADKKYMVSEGWMNLRLVFFDQQFNTPGNLLYIVSSWMESTCPLGVSPDWCSSAINDHHLSLANCSSSNLWAIQEAIHQVRPFSMSSWQHPN